MERSILIIDGHYFLFRSFAVPFKFYSKTVGIPLHVITTFLSLLRRNIEIIQNYSLVEGMIVVFDGQGQTQNSLINNQYKANRKQDFRKDSDSPFHHYPYISQVLSFLEIYNFEAVDYEADDYIASITERFKKQYKIYICSRDKDFYQLLSKSINQLELLKKGRYRIMNPYELKNDFDIIPDQFVEWRSMIGDSSDNIVGISGVGPVTATKIINGKKFLDLSQYKDLLENNMKLINLSREINLNIQKKDFLYTQNLFKLSNREIFEKCGFV